MLGFGSYNFTTYFMVNLVSGAGIQTHNLWDMNLLPLDQGSLPNL